MPEETGTDEPRTEESSNIEIDNRIRELYLQQGICEVAEKVSNIEQIELQYSIDETGHPSESGTLQILKQLHDAQLSKDPLMWNQDFILSEKPYRHVQSIFRYGCNICDKYGTDMSRKKYASQLVCDDCWENTILTQRPPNQALQAITTRLQLLESRCREEGVTPPSKRTKEEDQQLR